MLGGIFGFGREFVYEINMNFKILRVCGMNFVWIGSRNFLTVVKLLKN